MIPRNYFFKNGFRKKLADCVCKTADIFKILTIASHKFFLVQKNKVTFLGQMPYNRKEIIAS